MDVPHQYYVPQRRLDILRHIIASTHPSRGAASAAIEPRRVKDLRRLVLLSLLIRTPIKSLPRCLELDPASHRPWHPTQHEPIHRKLKTPTTNPPSHDPLPLITLPGAIQPSPTTTAYNAVASLLYALASHIASASPSGELHLPNVRPSRLYPSKYTIPLTVDMSEREVALLPAV